MIVRLYLLLVPTLEQILVADQLEIDVLDVHGEKKDAGHLRDADGLVLRQAEALALPGLLHLQRRAGQRGLRAQQLIGRADGGRVLREGDLR